MKHFTCDKCGHPMDKQKSYIIEDYEYDLCDICWKEIVKGLEDKGAYKPPQKREYDDPLERIRKYGGGK